MMQKAKVRKIRLDEAVVLRGLANNIALAQGLIMAGEISVNGKIISKAGANVLEDADIKRKESARFVSRAGEKLEAALQTFLVNISGKICADIGASTGGFTDCLLQHGAKKVYAIDVGHGLLHHSLVENPRVVVMDRTNARFLERLHEEVDIVTIDCSFISLKSILPQVKKWLPAGGKIIALIKPQFEASYKEVSRGKGVVKDLKIVNEILDDIKLFCANQGYSIEGLIPSPITGKKGGNQEYLIYLRR